MPMCHPPKIRGNFLLVVGETMEPGVDSRPICRAGANRNRNRIPELGRLARLKWYRLFVKRNRGFASLAVLARLFTSTETNSLSLSGLAWRLSGEMLEASCGIRSIACSPLGRMQS